MPGCADPVTGPAAGKCQAGSTKLLNYFLDTYPGTLNYGCYNPSSRNADGSLSLHVEGRAIDVGIPQGMKPTGDTIFSWCIFHADQIGLQEIIWYRQVWSHDVPYIHPWTAQPPHTDHVHIGLCWAGARGQLPWYGNPGPKPPPVQHPEIRFGSTGDAVRQWQLDLNALDGTKLVIDGDFGPLTLSATLDFQHFFGLVRDGIVGPITWGLADYLLAVTGRG